MKTKKLFTLAALLTSSLASAVDLADLENKYYVGLNFGGEYSSSLSLRPNLLIGYHYKKSSKLELEINSNIQSSENIGIGLLANYRYYPDIGLGPVTLYVSGGLGGYVQIIGGEVQVVTPINLQYLVKVTKDLQHQVQVVETKYMKYHKKTMMKNLRKKGLGKQLKRL